MGRKVNFARAERERLKSELLEILAKAPVIIAACQKVGITPKTFYDWKSRDRKFKKQVEEVIAEASEKVTGQAEINIIQSIKGGNLSSSKYWLSNHHPKYKKAANEDDEGKDNLFQEPDKQKIRQAINLSTPNFIQNETQQ